MAIVKYVSPILFFIVCLPSLASAQVVEWITFIKEDGLQYIEYQTRRTESSTYYLAFDKNSTLKEITKDILYIFPNSYNFDTSSDDKINKLQFSEGSYAILKSGNFENINIGKDGVYTYKSWDGKKYPNEQYGLSNFENGFKKVAATWVFPDIFEILDYESNKDGEWVKRGNAISFFGENINNITFKLRYRPRSRSTHDAIEKALEKNKQISLEQKDSGTKIVLKNAILFSSGSNALSDSGKLVLSKIVDVLKNRKLSIVVEGHADNELISGNLINVYPTNWELSAARALAVVRHLVNSGISQNLLEARAYSFTRARASNDTPEGRRENRRIEIFVVERPDKIKK